MSSEGRRATDGSGRRRRGAGAVERLCVHFRAQRVGTLVEWSFQYDPAWIESGGFALSSSLPLREAPYTEEARRWFANLLPEGGARERVARRLRLDPDDDFALLVELGGECAGAVTLDLETEAQPAESASRYRCLSVDELDELGRFGSVAVWSHEHPRLSLGGVQEKLPIRLDPTGLVCVPLDGAASTHLLKLPGRDDAALVENELLVLELARRVGLGVVAARPFPLGEGHALLVERYDRLPVEPARGTDPSRPGTEVMLPPVQRLHQEDFAQGLGVSRRNKYEADNGPSLADCARLIRENGLQPANELRALLRWFVFCLVVGNRDNHAKNLSRILDDQTGRWELAPFYDLVNTTGYKRLSRELAFFIGGENRVDRVTSSHWGTLAQHLEVASRLVLREVELMADRVDAHLSDAAAAVAESVDSEARLVQFTRAIEKSARLARASLR